MSPLFKMYKDGEERMPSSASEAYDLANDGWSANPPPDPNALPSDLPLRSLFGDLTLPQVKALVKELTPKILVRIKDVLK